MISKRTELHQSNSVLLFKSWEIINSKRRYSIEEIVKTIDELSEYEKEIKKITQQIINTGDTDIMSTLIERARAS